MSAVVLFLSFYIIMQVGLVMGKKGILFPWLGAWLPNIVFFVVGWVMISRMR
jgi:lipopolysaccharide export LptBFGC system permease protein LptF